jgi:DNA-damage-inducible protein J
MSVVINFKTDAQVKESAQAIAKEMGVSLSAVLNMYLKQFVRTKELDIRVESWDNLSDDSKEAIQEAEADSKAGKLKSYSPEEAIEYAKAMINE